MAEETNHYGATAAREHGRPGREARPRSITIDMHSHVLVPEAAALTGPHVDLAKVPLAHFATDNTKALNRKQDADRRPNMLDLAVRLRDMDAAGIDVQVHALQRLDRAVERGHAVELQHGRAHATMPPATRPGASASSSSPSPR